MTIAVAHDYFTQHGGAERVAATLVSHLKPIEVFTALHNAQETFGFGTDEATEIKTSFLQNVPFFRADPRRALLLLPLAWRLIGRPSADVVVCSSSGWSHAIRNRSSTRKVVYCHNIARWLYQPEDFFNGHHKVVQSIVKILAPILRSWDQRAARTADTYIANSSLVAKRIKVAYGIEAQVIHPPAAIDSEGPQREVAVPSQNFFIAVARSRGYKNLTALTEAFSGLENKHLAVIGAKAPRDGGQKNVTFLGRVNDAELRWLYAHSTALISVSSEDFGLTPIEANAMGTPALVIRAGGFLDTISPNVNGLFIDELSTEAIQAAIENFPSSWERSSIQEYARKFSVDAFIKEITRALKCEGLEIGISTPKV